MRRAIAFVTVLAGLAPISSFAQDSTPAAPEKKICRRSVATGSVMPKRTCHTKAEWDAIAARGQSDLDRQEAQERMRELAQRQREILK